MAEIDAGTQAIITQTAWAVVKEHQKTIDKQITDQLTLHSAQCKLAVSVANEAVKGHEKDCTLKKLSNRERVFAAGIGGTIALFGKSVLSAIWIKIFG